MLPEPRRYAADGVPLTASLFPRAGRGSGSHRLAGSASAGDSPASLAEAFRALAAEGRDDEIRAALAAAPSATAYGSLWRALCAAVEKPRESEVGARVFAIPWVIVCAGSTPATMSCVLPDAAALARVFEQHGVLGPSRSVGWSNALSALDVLESLAPSEVLRGWQSPAIRQAPPAPIAVLRGVEEVHLRFLLGAAIAPTHAPDVVETGGNIGLWGTHALNAMGAQLATPGVQVLAMPRPPAGLYTAATLGRRAAIEAAFNLFMSNTLRRFRLSVGDASVTLSSHEGAEVRVTLWSPLDDAMTEGFRWPLHPADDLDEIERTIADMVAECRLYEPHVAATVLPDRTASGAVLYPTVVE
jgi:hypothetical protein